MRILITGANGQLGIEFCRQLGGQARGLTRAELDITDRQAVLRFAHSERPLVVINCAAYTAVDRAEQDERKCLDVNGDAIANLADAAALVGATLVQISTDYVFGGDGSRQTPYCEHDLPVPQGAYARSKLRGEELALQYERSLLVRSCGLYGHSPRRNNFVEAILRLAQKRPVLRVVDDQRCNPTSAATLVRAVLFLLQMHQTGIFHVVSEPALTWFDFAREIVRQAGCAVDIEPITTEEYGAEATRPHFSVLDTGKYRSLGGPSLEPVGEALADYLGQRPIRAALDDSPSATAPPRISSAT